jgi:hypothetical protein
MNIVLIKVEDRIHEEKFRNTCLSYNEKIKPWI